MKAYVTKGSCIVLKSGIFYEGHEIELDEDQFERLEAKGKVSTDSPVADSSVEAKPKKVSKKSKKKEESKDKE